MIELSSDQFPAAASLFAMWHDHAAVGAMLRGIVPGRLFVDRVPAPRVAMLWDNGVLFFLAGEPEAADNGFISDISRVTAAELTPGLQARGLRRWVRATCGPEWESYLPAILGVDAVRPIPCKYLEYRATAPPLTPPLPSEITLETVDSTLLGRRDLSNVGDLRREISGTWGSIEAFVKHGFGYCLVEHDRLVSWCLSEYNYNGRCEFGVETAQDRQRLGYASHATAACVAHALATGIRPGWHSWRANEPSVGLALSCGFELAAEYVAHVIAKE